MKNKENIPNTLQRVLDNTTAGKNVFGSSVCIKTEDLDWCGVSGNFKEEEPFFIASVTKLYITAIFLILKQERKISLADAISKYLPENILKNLHVFKGAEYSKKISIRQLMAHTSGLPDYFLQKRENGKCLEQELLSGKDKAWTFDDIITDSKKLKPLFVPGKKGKAHYSDTNYQVLGAIIESIYNQKLEFIIQEVIAKPLGLEKTYLYFDTNDINPKNIYYKNSELHIPKAMTSFRADGGIVSTAKEMMLFLEAFFTGKIFPVAFIEELKQWNCIFYPLQSGIGIHRYKLPWIFSPFRPIPEIIGHSGLSGAFAYYCPTKDIYLSGTVNQIYKPGTSYRLMIKLLNALLY